MCPWRSQSQGVLLTQLRQLGFRPYPSVINIESGLVNVDGYRLAMAERWERFDGRMYDNVVTRVTIDAENPSTITSALLRIYEDMYAGARVVRPDNYYGFPSKQ